ncbi:MAG: hypothetical protein KDB23_23980, partial [Planctomycetales bacterium]|nr:hypothetical protein [Planctomycetales bacterium]
MLQNRIRTSIPISTWAYLAILSVIIVGAIMREINLLIVLAGLMVGPLVISWQLSRGTLRKLTARRTLPTSTFPGQPLRIEIELTNNRHRLDSWAVRIHDQIQLIKQAPTKTPTQPAICFLPHLPAGATGRTGY